MSLIRFAGVCKAYPSRTKRDVFALRDFDLELEQHEFFCLLGPSGCGKTTALSLLAGFETPTSGTVTLEGTAIAGPSRERGVVFQGDDSLFPWMTAVENVEFGLRMRGVPRDERRAAAMHYLALVGLGGQQDKHPSELSGGMKQRVQVARALANQPRVLLMDEPFGALDAQTRGTMQRELREIWRQTRASVFFITHDIDEAIVLASRIGIMTAGPGGTLREIIPVDLPAERARSDPEYGRYYDRIETSIREEVRLATSRAAEVA
jgi:NitT/TauT family transport system ATP-binding protein